MLSQITSRAWIFRRNITLPALILVVGLVALISFVPLTTYASFLGWAASNIFLKLAGFIGKICLALIDLLVSIVQYNDFINAPAVIKGWVIVRDVCNMFFIVVLLMIAFGTVFKIEEYQYQHTLSKLLIMAVLINFSKSITGFFIDLAQVVMLTFVNGFKEAAAGNFVNGFHLGDMFDLAANGNSKLEDSDALVWAALLALITISIATVVVGVYLVIFLIRIVALWFLIIVSPVAYLLSAFPGKAKQYSEEWWDYFGKYASSGPILAFFLWLSLAVMQTSNNVIGDLKLGQGDIGLFDVSVSKIGQSETLLSFIIGIILLLGGLYMAEHLGVAGGGLAKSALHSIQKAASSPFRAGAKYGKKLGRRAKENIGYALNRNIAQGKLPAWTNPAAIWRAREEARKERVHHAETISTAKARQTYEKTVRGVDVPYETMATRAIEAEEMKKYSGLSKEQKADMFVQLDKRLKKNPNDFQAHHQRNALLLGAAPESHNDDIIGSEYMRNEYEWKDHDGNTQKGLAIKMKKKMKKDENGNDVEDLDKDGHLQYEEVKDEHGHAQRGELTKDEIAAGYVQKIHDFDIVHDFFGSLGHSQEDMRVVFDVGELMKHAGHYQGAEHARFEYVKIPELDQDGKEKRDPKTNKVIYKKDSKGKDIVKKEWIMQSKNKAKKDALYEFSKIGKRQQKQSAVHNFNTIYYDDANEQTIWGRGQEGSFEKNNFEGVLLDSDTQDTGRFTQERTGSAVFGGVLNKDTGFAELNNLTLTLSGLKDEYRNNREAIRALCKRSAAQGIHYKGDKGEEFNLANTDYDGYAIDGLAKKLNWFSPEEWEKIEQEKQQAKPPKQNKMEDVSIDEEKQARTQLAIDSYKKEKGSDKADEDFFNSNEFKSEQSKYYNKDQYSQNKMVLDNKINPQKGGLSVNAFARGQGKANELSVDFSKLNLDFLGDAAGANITDKDLIQETAKVLLEVVKDELNKIKQKSIKTPQDEQRIKNFEISISRLEKPESLDNLVLYNTNRRGVGGRKLISHEASHVALSLADPDSNIQSQLWNNELTPGQRRSITEKIKSTVGSAEMSNSEVMHEYFAEGLRNETIWKDDSPDAIKLTESMKKKLEDRIKDLTKPVAQSNE